MAPIYLLRPSCVPWTGGVISLAAVVERLKDLLPPTFEDLNTVRPHGVPQTCWPAVMVVADVLAFVSCLRDQYRQHPTLCGPETDRLG